MHFVRTCTCTVLYTVAQWKVNFLLTHTTGTLLCNRPCTRLFSFLPCISIPKHQTRRHFSSCSIPCATCTYRHCRLRTHHCPDLYSLCARRGWVRVDICFYLMPIYTGQFVRSTWYDLTLCSASLE